MANRFNFDRVLHNFEKLKKELPVVIANDTQNFFRQSWDRQGWEDAELKSWAPRQKETKKTEGKLILVGTGKLRRAVANSIRDKRFDLIRLVIDGGSIPYAKAHNEGLGHMPQRQFMGDSKALRRRQIDKIKKHIDKIWKA